MKINFLLFIAIIICLSGCTTMQLWHTENYASKTKSENTVTADKLYISNDFNYICIKYSDLNSNVTKYLIIEPGSNINTKLLEAMLLNGKSNQLIKYIYAEARQHDTIKYTHNSYLKITFELTNESVIYNSFGVNISDYLKPGSGSTEPRREINNKDNTITLNFGVYSGGLPVPLLMKHVSLTNHIDNLDSNYKLLNQASNIPMKLILSETKDQYQPGIIAFQLICTPFTVAFDALTSPIQLLWAVYGKKG
jgi:uncharacterized protein YceK